MKIFYTVLLLFFLGLSLSLGFDNGALSLQDEAMQRAMAAFGLAKGLNTVISLIQGTEVSFTPVGLGINFSVGEVLDPFNDMVERFSWVMLLSSVSLGIQKLLILLSSKLFLQVSILLSVGIALSCIWIKKLANSNVLAISLKLFMLFILLRFSAIFFVYSSELLYNSVLHTEYQHSTQIIKETKEKLEDINEKSKEIVISKKEQGFIESIRSKSVGLVDSLNISQKLSSLEKDIDMASRNIINLITIFLLQSLFMPLLFLWFFVLSIKLIFKIEIDTNKLVYNYPKINIKD